MGGGILALRVNVPVDPEKLAMLEALPYKRPRNEWTPEQDAILIRYWATREHLAVARIIGINPETCRKRYRELTEGKE